MADHKGSGISFGMTKIFHVSSPENRRKLLNSSMPLKERNYRYVPPREAAEIQLGKCNIQDSNILMRDNRKNPRNRNITAKEITNYKKPELLLRSRLKEPVAKASNAIHIAAANCEQCSLWKNKPQTILQPCWGERAEAQEKSLSEKRSENLHTYNSQL